MNGIGIDIDGVNPAVAPATFTMPQVAPAPVVAQVEMPQVAAAPAPVSNVTAPAPEAFAMPVMPQVNVAPVGVVHQNIVSEAPIEPPSVMVANTAPGVSPIHNAYAAPVDPAVIAQLAAQANPVYAAPAPVMDATNMAALGIEDTIVTPTVLPVTQVEAAIPVAQQPLTVDEQNGLVSRMSAAQFDNFIKILESINSDSNVLVNQINNGLITLIREGGQLTTKIEHIFGNNSWVLNNPAVQLKRLKFAKAEAETLIIDDGDFDKLVSKNNKGEITTITKLAKIDGEFMPQVLNKDYGERKYSITVAKDLIKNLVDARVSYEKSTYNITLDANTFEIVKLHLGKEYVRNLLGEEGRVLKTYVVTQLFPIPEEAVISVYINDRNEVSFKSSVDIYNATISFQIGADEYVESMVANLQI